MFPNHCQYIVIVHALKRMILKIGTNKKKFYAIISSI